MCLSATSIAVEPHSGPPRKMIKAMNVRLVLAGEHQTDIHRPWSRPTRIVPAANERPHT
jgi:hypothetical protein